MSKPISIDQTHTEYCVECVYCEDSLISSNVVDRVVELANELGFTADNDGMPVCKKCREENEQ